MVDRCFFEDEPGASIARRAFGELLGTTLLALAVTGSTLTAQRLSAMGTPLAVLLSALAGGGALFALIVSLGPLSGAHFNPLITLLQWMARERTAACTLAYVSAQLAGGFIGALAANRLLQMAVRATASATGSQALVSEFLAATALMVIVRACSRTSVRDGGPMAVAAWLAAAIAATPTLSIANPAIAMAALVTNGPLALDATTVRNFIGVELAGALTAFGISSLLYPKRVPAPNQGART